MKEMYKSLNIIGADETGVGDYLSPLVACACFVPKENVQKLEKIGIIDSKKLSDKMIIELANKIKKLVVYRVMHLTQSGYNKLTNSFNANELKMFLHIKAINAVEEKIKGADLIILDKFSTESSIKKYYKRLLEEKFNFRHFNAKMKLVEKGENEHVAVAAASILGRQFLLELMRKQDTEYKTHFPLGTNKFVEEFARKFVNKHGKSEFEKVAKLSFKTTKKVLHD